MEDWNGRETADIVYDDHAGVFTEFLIDKGYLAPQTWRGCKPQYYVEVKSTTGPCGLPFFMSKYQYRRVSLPALFFPSG